jgi:predicted MFS family arabinose efflux permease
MVRVRATIHSLFPDAARSQAFAILARARAGAGGLHRRRLARALGHGLGWRTMFFINGPIGAALVLATTWLMPLAESKCAQLDSGVLVLFAGLTLLVGPL